MATFTLAGTEQALLPKNISNEIWAQATALSIIPSLSSNASIVLGDNVFPTLTQRPSAGIVGEGGQKPGSDIALGAKTIRPVKAAVGLEFTEEAIRSNPAGILGLMQTELSGAIARQIDLAVLHGRAANTGAALTSGQEYLNQTTNRVELTGGTNADKELWDGYGLVVEGNNNFTGFAIDPRLVFSLATARDSNGRRQNPEIQMGAAVTSYAGQPVAVSKAVSGQVDASVDTSVRAFGGDWDALKFGYNMGINVRQIPYGDPFGNGDLAGRNSVAYLAEAIFGWAILDTDAFVAYEDAVANV